MGKTRIGIVTTGQSPRKEYTSLHRNAFKNMGLEVEIIEAGALDGLTLKEIQAMDCAEKETGIGCYAHAGDSTDKRMGAGRLEVWMSINKFHPRVQMCIDKLEKEKVEMILLCCAEEYPETAFHSKVPFIMPYKIAFSKVQMLLGTLDRPQIGVLIPDQKHYDQDLWTWSSKAWMRNIDVYIGIGIIDGNGCSQIKGRKLDLVFVWGYGEGVAPGDPKNLIQDLEAQLKAPVITPSSLNLHFARNMLRPALNEPSFTDLVNG